jgi:hypothetical protein
MANEDPDAVASTTEQESNVKKPIWRRAIVIIPVLVIVVLLGVVASLAFQPWKLFVDDVVDEPIPTASQVAPQPATTPIAPTGSPSQPPTQAGPVVLASGQFVSHEHDTTGKAKVLRLADGSNVLRLENLDTSNGPDLKVWLSKAPVIEGKDGWFVFNDYKHVDLGALKGNVGNQNYKIPDNVDPSNYSSVVIWCDRFSVSFGAAELS